MDSTTNLYFKSPTQVINSGETQVFNQNTLNEVTETFFKWVKVAISVDINIEKQIQKLFQVISDAPSHTHPRNAFEQEITIIQQIVMRSIYCNQIIRKIIKKAIDFEIAEIGKISTNYFLINTYDEELRGLIPHKICLSSIDKVRGVYIEVMEMLEMMKNEIANDNKGITSNNLFNKCGY